MQTFTGAYMRVILELPLQILSYILFFMAQSRSRLACLLCTQGTLPKAREQRALCPLPRVTGAKTVTKDISAVFCLLELGSNRDSVNDGLNLYRMRKKYLVNQHRQDPTPPFQ